MHAIQLRFKKMAVTDKNANDLSDYGLDPTNGPIPITSDDIKKSYNCTDCKIILFYKVCSPLFYPLSASVMFY